MPTNITLSDVEAPLAADALASQARILSAYSTQKRLDADQAVANLLNAQSLVLGALAERIRQGTP